MGKYAGRVGFVTESETVPGVWSATEEILEMQGDVLKSSSSYQGADKINKDIILQHRISLMGNSYLYQRYSELRWVEYLGVKWEVTSIEFSSPRVTVTLGGVWNAK